MFFIDRLSNVSLLASLLISSFMVQAQTAEPASDTTVLEQSASEEKAYDFPPWPQRRHARRERVPPPPPGPYMSTALSGNSIKAPTFANRVKKRAVAFDSSDVVMDTFSPDVPWPTNMRPPSRWVPENGYRFVEPQAIENNQRSVPVAANRYNYWPQGPSMNGSSMRFGQNPVSNRAGGQRMSMPDMRASDSRARAGNVPGRMQPVMRSSANRGQMMPSSGSPKAYISNRGPSRQVSRQGGLQ